MAYENTFGYAQYLGFFDVFLPFILVFVIVFAILQKIHIFGEKDKRYNAVLALVMGLAFVVPHILYGTGDPTDRYLTTGFVDPVNVVNQSLPSVGVVAIAVIMVLLLIGVFGGNWKLGGNSVSGWIAILCFATIVFIFGGAAGWWDNMYFQWLWNDPDTMALVVTVLAFGLIIWFITKEDKPKNEKSSFGKFLDELSDNAKSK